MPPLLNPPQVCTFGGVYADADTIPTRPIASWPLEAAMPQDWWWNPKLSEKRYLDEIARDAAAGWESSRWVQAQPYAKSPTASVRFMDTPWQGTRMPPPPHVGALVGWEQNNPDDKEWGSFARSYQFLQWALAGQPGHPLVCGMGQRIARFREVEKARLRAAEQSGTLLAEVTVVWCDLPAQLLVVPQNLSFCCWHWWCVDCHLNL